MMKRFLFLCLALLPLVLSCKKDEINFNENDLVGAWVCTEWVTGSNEPLANPDISFEVKADRTSEFHSGAADNYHLTWAIQGDKLELSGYDSFQKCTLKKLDKKHFVWILTYDDGKQARASFTNLLQVLPGKWRIESTSYGQMDITIEATGTSTWAKGDADPEIIKWSLVFGGERAYPHIKWEGVNVDFADSFDIYDVTDDQIDMKSASHLPVTFTRQ